MVTSGLLLLAGCSSSTMAPAPATSASPATQTSTSTSASRATTGATTPSRPATTASTSAAAPPAAGALPTSCAAVTVPALLQRLEVQTSATQAYTAPDKAPMPTSEPQAQEESRTWPGLSCLYKANAQDQELMILVMPDSAWFSKRSTTTCLPTYGKGSAVDLGGTAGWYCPTTNESPGEWVSFVHGGRLVTVNRVSAPTGKSPYKDALVAYATELTKRL